MSTVHSIPVDEFSSPSSLRQRKSKSRTGSKKGGSSHKWSKSYHRKTNSMKGPNSPGQDMPVVHSMDHYESSILQSKHNLTLQSTPSVTTISTNVPSRDQDQDFFDTPPKTPLPQPFGKRKASSKRFTIEVDTPGRGSSSRGYGGQGNSPSSSSSSPSSSSNGLSGMKIPSPSSRMGPSNGSLPTDKKPKRRMRSKGKDKEDSEGKEKGMGMPSLPIMPSLPPPPLDDDQGDDDDIHPHSLSSSLVAEEDTQDDDDDPSEDDPLAPFLLRRGCPHVDLDSPSSKSNSSLPSDASQLFGMRRSHRQSPAQEKKMQRQTRVHDTLQSLFVDRYLSACPDKYGMLTQPSLIEGRLVVLIRAGDYKGFFHTIRYLMQPYNLEGDTRSLRDILRNIKPNTLLVECFRVHWNFALDHDHWRPSKFDTSLKDGTPEKIQYDHFQHERAFYREAIALKLISSNKEFKFKFNSPVFALIAEEAKRTLFSLHLVERATHEQQVVCVPPAHILPDVLEQLKSQGRLDLLELHDKGLDATDSKLHREASVQEIMHQMSTKEVQGGEIHGLLDQMYQQKYDHLFPNQGEEETNMILSLAMMLRLRMETLFMKVYRQQKKIYSRLSPASSCTFMRGKTLFHIACGMCLFKAVDFLMEEIDPMTPLPACNMRDFDGNLPWHDLFNTFEVQGRRREYQYLIALIIKKRTKDTDMYLEDVSNDRGFAPIHLALRNGIKTEHLEKILDLYPYWAAAVTEKQGTPYHILAESKQDNVEECLHCIHSRQGTVYSILGHDQRIRQESVQHNMNHQRKTDGFTALHIAATHENLGAFRWLIEHGANSTAFTHDAENVMHIIARNEVCNEYMELLLSGDPEKDMQSLAEPSSSTFTVLTSAVLEPTGEVVDFFRSAKVQEATKLWYEEGNKVQETLIVHRPDSCWSGLKMWGYERLRASSARRFNLSAFFIYAVMLTVVILATQEQRRTEFFEITNAVENAILPEDGDTSEKFWDWMEGKVKPVLAPNLIPNPKYVASSNGTIPKEILAPRWLSNRVVGNTIRIRQWRRIDNRTTAERVQNGVGGCVRCRNTTAFGNGTKYTTTNHTFEGPFGSFDPGMVARFRSYDELAFHQIIITNSSTDMQKNMDALKKGQFIDEYTAAVRMDVSMFNNQTKALLLFSILIEYPSSGHSYVMSQFETTATDPSGLFWVMAIASVIMGLIGTVLELREVYKWVGRSYVYFDSKRDHQKKREKQEAKKRKRASSNVVKNVTFESDTRQDWLDDEREDEQDREPIDNQTHFNICFRGLVWWFNFWNVLDILIPLCLTIYFTDLLQVASATEQLNAELVSTATVQYVNLTSLMDRLQTWNNLISVVLFFAFFKLLKYLSMFKAAGSHMIQALLSMINNVFQFLVMFTVVTLAFTIAFYNSFGYRLEIFSNYPRSIYTLTRALFGDIDLEQLERVNYLMGRTLFTIFFVVSFLVMLNLIIAVLSERYENVESNRDAVYALDLASKIVEYETNNDVGYRRTDTARKNTSHHIGASNQVVPTLRVSDLEAGSTDLTHRDGTEDFKRYCRTILEEESDEEREYLKIDTHAPDEEFIGTESGSSGEEDWDDEEWEEGEEESESLLPTTSVPVLQPTLISDNPSADGSAAGGGNSQVTHELLTNLLREQQSLRDLVSKLSEQLEKQNKEGEKEESEGDQQHH